MCKISIRRNVQNIFEVSVATTDEARTYSSIAEANREIMDNIKLNRYNNIYGNGKRCNANIP